jgi:DNA repair exonuclease SbcCD ATPase subunit
LKEIAMNDAPTGMETMPTDDTGIVPEDERDDILREIEESIGKSRGSLNLESNSASSGAAIPAAVNAGALVLMALTLLIVPRIYDTGERRLVDPSTSDTYDSAGLYRALRREADERIEERETTIEALQEEYGRVLSEREALRENFDARLALKANELESGLRTAIEAERRRLASSDLADEAIETGLRDLEARLQDERAKELQAYEESLRAESASRERELAAAASRYGEELTRRTDPLTAEIELLMAQREMQRASERELSRRNDEAAAEIARLESERDGLAESRRRDRLEFSAFEARSRAEEAARLALRNRVEAMLDKPGETERGTGSDQAALGTRIDLMQAKVEARRIIAAEPVRSEYPDLAERLDRFFLYSEEEYRTAGRLAGIAEIAALIDAIAARRAPQEREAYDPALRPILESLLELLE